MNKYLVLFCGAVIALWSASGTGRAQGVVEFAPYVCSESYPQACADPAERSRMEANRKRSLEQESARRAADRAERAAKEKAREAELAETAARLGLPDHRRDEAQRYLDMRNAAAVAKGASAECRAAPKTLIQTSPFLDTRSEAESRLHNAKPETLCPDGAGGTRGAITCEQTATRWQCKMTVRCTASQLVACPPSSASKQ